MQIYETSSEVRTFRDIQILAVQNKKILNMKIHCEAHIGPKIQLAPQLVMFCSQMKQLSTLYYFFKT